MKYDGEKDYKHGSKEKLGVLITNLGTPDRPRIKELRAYLKEFLSDPRGIEAPKLLWQIILRIIILNRTSGVLSFKTENLIILDCILLLVKNNLSVIKYE